MRSLIFSQWRDLRIGVTREDLGALTTVRARQFSTLRNETNVIIYYYLIPCCLSTDPEIYDLG